MPTEVDSITGPGGDYEVFSSWEAATDGDLTVDDELHRCLIRGLHVNGSAVACNGATTSDTQYREVTVETQRFNPATGIGDGLASTTSACLNGSEAHLRFTNLWVESQATSAGYTSTFDDSVGVTGQIVTNCVFRRKGGQVGASDGAVYAKGGSTNTGIVFYNCVFWVDEDVRFGALPYSRDCKFINCTSYGAYDYPFLGTSSGTYDAAHEITNCIGIHQPGREGALSAFAGLDTTKGSNNVGSSSMSYSASYASETGSNIFEDAENGDFRVKTTGNAYGNGLDKSSTFTDDADGISRTTTNNGWSIGAHMHAIVEVESTVGVGMDYTTFSGAETAIQADHRAAHEIHRLRLSDLLSESGNVSGSTSDAHRYVEITHNGTPYNPITGVGPGMESSSSGQSTLTLSDDFVRVSGLGLFNTENSTSYAQSLAMSGNNCTVDRCYIERGSTGASNNCVGVRITETSLGNTFKNSLVVTTATEGNSSGILAWCADQKIHNVTVYGGPDDGLAGHWATVYTTVEIHNVALIGAGNTDLQKSNLPDSAFKNVITSDATGAGLANSHTSIAPANLFRDAANNDFRLLPTAVARGAGVAIDDKERDIAGRPWKNPPSIGAYEFASGRRYPVSPCGPGRLMNCI